MHHLSSPWKIPSSSSPSLSDKSSLCFFAWAPVIEAGRDIERHREIQNSMFDNTQMATGAIPYESVIETTWEQYTMLIPIHVSHLKI